MGEERQVRLTLKNDSGRTLTFGLEPRGNFGEVPPGASVGASLSLVGGEAHLALVVVDDGLVVWEEEGDTLLDPNREAPGGELWASSESPG